MAIVCRLGVSAPQSQIILLTAARCAQSVMLLLFTLLHASALVGSMADSSTEKRTIGHIVLIASPFYGHMIPILDFAKRLSIHHHVTYIVSASKLDMLQRRGFIDEITNESDSSVQPKLDVIGIRDGNNDDYEVSSARSRLTSHQVIIRISDGGVG